MMNLKATTTIQHSLISFTFTMMSSQRCLGLLLLSTSLLLWTSSSVAFVSQTGRVPRKNGEAYSLGFSSTAKSLDHQHQVGNHHATCLSAQTEAAAAEASENAPMETTNNDSDDNDDTSRQLSLLNDAIRSFDSLAAKALLDEITEMRTSGVDQTVMDATLNKILNRGPDQKLPVWTKLRPLARFSKRVRLASLNKALDFSTPPPNESDNEEGDNELSQQRRRRRALVSLLRTLSEPDDGNTNDNDSNSSKRAKGTSTAIVQIERKAKRAKKLVGDMRDRLPPGLETPKYDVIGNKKRSSSNGGRFEIRRYEAFTVCSVSMTKSRPEDAFKTDATVSDPKMSGAKSFGALAGYLFGKNQQETAMKMTTPVLTNGQGDDRQMSFILPSEFWNENALDNAPRPMEGSGVSLERNKGGERAVVMFGGYASKTEVDQQKKKLKSMLSSDKEWEAVDESEQVALAQYNDPFTPPWKRLNEVSISVQSRNA